MEIWILIRGCGFVSLGLIVLGYWDCNWKFESCELCYFVHSIVCWCLRRVLLVFFLCDRFRVLCIPAAVERTRGQPPILIVGPLSQRPLGGHTISPRQAPVLLAARRLVCCPLAAWLRIPVARFRPLVQVPLGSVFYLKFLFSTFQLQSQYPNTLNPRETNPHPRITIKISTRRPSKLKSIRNAHTVFALFSNQFRSNSQHENIPNH